MIGSCERRGGEAMKVIAQRGNVRLIEALGRYMETRYEVEEAYSYWEHCDDIFPTAAWKLKCYSTDFEQACEMFRRHAGQDEENEQPAMADCRDEYANKTPDAIIAENDFKEVRREGKEEAE